jgi:hypothetical protein
MTETHEIQPPKAMFKQTKVLHDAIVDHGTDPTSVSLDRADTVMRAMNKTPVWKEQHNDILGTWIRGGDPWMDMIKAVRAYGRQVINYHKAVERAAEKAKKDADKATAKAAKISQN